MLCLPAPGYVIICYLAIHIFLTVNYLAGNGLGFSSSNAFPDAPAVNSRIPDFSYVSEMKIHSLCTSNVAQDPELCRQKLILAKGKFFFRWTQKCGDVFNPTCLKLKRGIYKL
jgi:hypothetical protein